MDAPWGLVNAEPRVRRLGPGFRAIAAIAEEQDGMVTLGQLSYAGFSAGRVRQACRAGSIERVHRGVFAVGHRSKSPTAPATAAVLAVGGGSVVSHRHAAAAQALLPIAIGVVDLTMPPPVRRSRPGIRVHHSTTLAPADVTRISGLPITRPARTLLDLADSGDDFETALNEARALRVINDDGLRAVIARNEGRPGAAVLRCLLSSERDPGFSRSGAERILRKLIRAAGLPDPQRNVRIHGAELDFYWPAAHLNAETDGFAVHGRRRNFESDRDRDARLAALGIQVLRFTWWQLTREAPKVVARLAAAIALRTSKP